MPSYTFVSHDRKFCNAMKRGVCNDRVEQIKWWDALDELLAALEPGRFERAMRMVRDCRHPDAQWLASLFPPDVAVTREDVEAMMLQQRDDPRAMYLLCRLRPNADESDELSARAASMGYAPAQVWMSYVVRDDQEALRLAQLAAAQGDRLGLFHMGYRLLRGECCDMDKAKGKEFVRQAAELDLPAAMYFYGNEFSEYGWERYYWRWRAASRGYSSHAFCDAVLRFLPRFDAGECGRILAIAASLISGNLDVEGGQMFWLPLQPVQIEKLLRVVELHRQMLQRARRAIACWSVVGLRYGVVKDVRVMVAKMAWEEAWQWGEKKKMEIHVVRWWDWRTALS
jgi:hypothetical protein